MSLGDRLGLAGAILTLFALAATILWPDKRWIGWLSLSCAVGLLLMWVGLEVGADLSKFRVRYPALFPALVFIVGGCLAVSLLRLLPTKSQPQKDLPQKEQQAVTTAGPARPTSEKDGDSESYIPWGNDKVTIINSGFGNLPDVKAGRISNSLLDSGITGSIRIVFVGAFHPELADELFAEFQRGGWQPEILQVDMILEKHAQESLYLLSPDLGGQKTRAAINALGRADLSIPAYTGKPTVGPTSAGIPDVTIVIKQ